MEVKMAATFDQDTFKEIPATVLGVIIGTLLINKKETEEDQEYPYCWFGYIPNEKGRQVLPFDAVKLLDWCNNSLKNRYNWSFAINHESGGISIISDEDEDEEEENENENEGDEERSDFPGNIVIPDIEWRKLFE